MRALKWCCCISSCSKPPRQNAHHRFTFKSSWMMDQPLSNRCNLTARAVCRRWSRPGSNSQDSMEIQPLRKHTQRVSRCCSELGCYSKSKKKSWSDVIAGWLCPLHVSSHVVMSGQTVQESSCMYNTAQPTVMDCFIVNIPSPKIVICSCGSFINIKSRSNNVQEIIWKDLVVVDG